MEGEITRVEPYSLLTVNDENLAGGEKSVRIYFNNTDEDIVTMTIRPKENSIFNITGTPMGSNRGSIDTKLAKVYPRLTGASIEQETNTWTCTLTGRSID